MNYRTLTKMTLSGLLFFGLQCSAMNTTGLARLGTALSIFPAHIAYNVYTKKGDAKRANNAKLFVHSLRAIHNTLAIATCDKDNTPGYQIAWLPYEVFEIFNNIWQRIKKSDVTPHEKHLRKKAVNTLSQKEETAVRKACKALSMGLFPIIESSAFTLAALNIKKDERKAQLIFESIGYLSIIIDNYLAADKNSIDSEFWLSALIFQSFLTCGHLIDCGLISSQEPSERIDTRTILSDGAQNRQNEGRSHTTRSRRRSRSPQNRNVNYDPGTAHYLGISGHNPQATHDTSDQSSSSSSDSISENQSESDTSNRNSNDSSSVTSSESSTNSTPNQRPRRSARLAGRPRINYKF